jgi:hypothetical protein
MYKVLAKFQSHERYEVIRDNLTYYEAKRIMMGLRKSGYAAIIMPEA